MSRIRDIAGTTRRALRYVRARLWGAQLEDPVFIIGCGRSGTTILGTVLSMHSAVTYLNERRDLWIAAYPVTDIWSGVAATRRGKLVLTGTDAGTSGDTTLKRLFQMEVRRSGRPLLIDKLPINCFRLGFLASIFPRARYIHIHRNGLEVARSIERYCETQKWFGVDDYKWKLLATHAAGTREVSALPELCTSPFLKGLLEWRLGFDLTQAFLGTLPSESYIEVSYADFVSNPVDSAAGICSFLGLGIEQPMESFLREKVGRKSEEVRMSEVPDLARRIGGDVLQSYVEKAVHERHGSTSASAHELNP